MSNPLTLTDGSNPRVLSLQELPLTGLELQVMERAKRGEAKYSKMEWHILLALQVLGLVYCVQSGTKFAATLSGTGKMMLDNHKGRG